MATHEYSARQALDLLMKMVAARDERLATDIQTAIDAGRDVEEEEPVRGRRKKKARSYRLTVRFTDEEALHVAIKVLEAHFIEQPLFVESAVQEFAHAGIGDEADGRIPWALDDSPKRLPEGIGAAKDLEVEVQTETQIVRFDASGAPTISLGPISAESIHQQRDHLAKLYALADFGGY